MKKERKYVLPVLTMITAVLAISAIVVFKDTVTKGTKECSQRNIEMILR